MKLSAPVYHLKRQAKSRARELGIPHNQALDQLARDEGFNSWSHLAASLANDSPAKTLFERARPGDLILLGARPGHGKTLMALELLAHAVHSGNHAMLFTLESTQQEVAQRLESIGQSLAALGDRFVSDNSDDISAEYIIQRLAQTAPGTVVVVDYLQLLDQKRENPDLLDQVKALKGFAELKKITIVFISQVDRSFENTRESDATPRLTDVRMPNPIDLSLFNSSCFLHDGKVQINATG
jgi:replicative DNA helicase